MPPLELKRQPWFPFIFFERETPVNKTPLESIKSLEEQIISSRDLALPFDIKISNRGYKIERLGKPLQEDIGRRIFIIPNPVLDQFYEEGNHSSKELYQFLKHNDIGGRRLALGNEPIEIDPKRSSSYKLIIKLIEHETENRWNTFDLARFNFSPVKGLTKEFVERLIYWYGDRLLNLSLATRDAPLHIIEPYESTLSERDKDYLHSSKEGEDYLNEQDKKLFHPKTNSLIVVPLRKKLKPVGGTAAPIGGMPPRFEAYIFHNSGIISVQINHTEDDPTKYCSGINRINVGDTTYYLNGKTSLNIPLSDHQGNNTLSFFYNDRLGLKLGLKKDTSGQILADFEQGIEEIKMPPYNPSQGIVIHLSAEEMARRYLEEKAKKDNVQRAEEEKKRKKIGTNEPLLS